MIELPLEIFFGQATSAEARVYARLDLDDAPREFTWGGTVRGPFCRYAQTLPATMPLRDVGPGDPPLAQAFVPDPCLWTPAAPYYYEVRVEIARGEETIAAHERMLGFRPLAPSGRNLFLEGRRWVLRGGAIETMDGAKEKLAENLAAWREASCAIVVPNPSDELCEAASRIGVLLVADSRAIPEKDLAEELHRLARWPAVGMALLPVGARPDFSRRRKPKNLLLAEHFGQGQPLNLTAWADLAFCEDANVEALGARAVGASVPVVVVRATATAAKLNPAETRAACDRLQRDLAPWADLAGYVV